ncbi:YmfQ family protein [Bacillus sp. FJAT-45350]|uniref:YmfQ family protein n=1 Tax=Bacillus sp. FJAT-45350 TaxID=2011014 RepID=UPI00211D12D0|nr:YmfQ family protein [Bacillus sp. FJAT-45350]
MLELSNEMIKTLPLFMRKDEIIIEIFGAQQKKFNSYRDAIEEIMMQLDVDTATWGLDIYEKELDIPVDRSKPFDERRSVIKSKWRGSGKVDQILLKIVADSFTNGDVEVSFDNGVIGIQFTSETGIPPNLEDAQNALEDTRPAHLPIRYFFRYLTIGEVHDLTIGKMHNMTLDNFAGGAS